MLKEDPLLECYTAALCVLRRIDPQFVVTSDDGIDSNLQHMVIKDTLLQIAGLMSSVSTTDGTTVNLRDPNDDDVTGISSLCKKILFYLSNDTITRTVEDLEGNKKEVKTNLFDPILLRVCPHAPHPMSDLKSLYKTICETLMDNPGLRDGVYLAAN